MLPRWPARPGPPPAGSPPTSRPAQRAAPAWSAPAPPRSGTPARRANPCAPPGPAAYTRRWRWARRTPTSPAPGSTGGSAGTPRRPRWAQHPGRSREHTGTGRGCGLGRSRAWEHTRAGGCPRRRAHPAHRPGRVQRLPAWRRAPGADLRRDAAGGSVFAVVALLLAVWFVGLNLTSGPWPPLSREIRRSAIIRSLDTALPEPPSLLGQVRRFLNDFGFPEVFAGLPPAPGGPVKGPTNAQANEAFRDAAGSTLKVVGQACGRIQEGSGFVVTPGYVVTNAHVVAGVRDPHVQVQNGGSRPAVPVLFDSRLDVAILHVSSTPPPLPLVDHEVGRGASGAVVGYPGGGDLSGVAAANRRVLHAVGRDIYGNGTVVRNIYELQAVVRPGNSGGPFVLVNGQVAGLVFAASTTDRGIGYAITSTEISDDVHQGTRSTAQVATGGCTR